MKNYQIYLAGGMGKFGKENFNDGNSWRVTCKQVFESHDGAVVVNPNDFFNFIDEPPAYETQREVMEFDLNKVRHSDLIVVNFNDKYSLGTMAEIAIAYEKRIPIIGLDADNQDLHPWQIEMSNRIFTNISDMLQYVEDFYLT